MADMDAALPALTEMPSPQYVMSGDGIRIATYLWGEEDAPTPDEIWDRLRELIRGRVADLF